MISRALTTKFENIAGKENVFTDKADRVVYSYDAAVLEPEIPALVVRPVTVEALGKIVRLCNENRLPLTVRGAGAGIHENLKYLYEKPGNIEKILEQHRQIYQAIQKHDPNMALETMKEHFQFVLDFFKLRDD